MEEYEKICRKFRRCQLIELCDGKGIIVSGKNESRCLDYEPEGKYYKDIPIEIKHELF